MSTDWTWTRTRRPQYDCARVSDYNVIDCYFLNFVAVINCAPKAARKKAAATAQRIHFSFLKRLAVRARFTSTKAHWHWCWAVRVLCVCVCTETADQFVVYNFYHGKPFSRYSFNIARLIYHYLFDFGYLIKNLLPTLSQHFSLMWLLRLLIMFH